jgi:hypothetical protein
MIKTPRSVGAGVAATAVSLVLGGAAILASTSNLTHRAQDEAAPGNRDNAVATFLTGSDKPNYPEKWRSTLDEALAKATFKVFVPSKDSGLADMSDVFLMPEGVALAMAYPPLTNSDTVRQTYIEVYETDWSEGNALTSFQDEIAAVPIDGQSITTLSDGTPALTVRPASDSDPEHANPAYVEFVLNGTDIQVFGGDSLARLLAVANDLVSSQAVAS